MEVFDSIYSNEIQEKGISIINLASCFGFFVDLKFILCELTSKIPDFSS